MEKTTAREKKPTFLRLNTREARGTAKVSVDLPLTFVTGYKWTFADFL